jgi:hypothetical protein
MLWQEWSQQGLNAMGELVADIIVETLQNAGVNSRHPARPWRGRLGNGEGEFPLGEALFCLTEAQRPGGVEV